MHASQPSAEAERNRLLRRVDWLVLLPVSEPRRTVCFAEGLLARAVAANSDEIAEPETAAGDCDLAVVRDPDKSTLRRAAAALRPGGALYGEWYFPQVGGTAAIRRALEAAQLEDVKCYWPWPWPDRRGQQFWLPLEAPEASRFFLETRPRPATLRARVTRAGLVALWRFAVRLRLLVPVCAVATKPGGGPSAGALARIRGGWSRWGLGSPPERLSWFLLSPGGRSISKIIGLVFADNEPEPRLLCKISRTPEARTALEREAANLGALARSRVGMPGVPDLLFAETAGDRAVVGETVLSGRPLYTVLRPQSYRPLALAVTNWLAELAGSPTWEPPERWWSEIAEPAITSFERSFRALVEPSELAAARKLVGSLGHLPRVPEHRDCAPWNVLVDDQQRVALPDWESAEPHGLPALDLIYFLTYAGFFIDGAMSSYRFLESYRGLQRPDSLAGAVTAECQARYLRRLELDGSVLAALRVLTWVIHSASEVEHMKADVASGYGSPRLDKSLFLSLWRQELASAGRSSHHPSRRPVP